MWGISGIGGTQNGQENIMKYFKSMKKILSGPLLDAFSSNKNPSILLGSLYLIGEFKKRKLL